MKKMFIVLATGLITTAAIAQENSKPMPPAPPPLADLVAIPAPPPAPPPPPAKTPQKPIFKPPVIVNNKGYAVKVVTANTEDPVILLSKKGFTHKIRMSVWKAKPAYFSNKYGEIPPPPPPLQ